MFSEPRKNNLTRHSLEANDRKWFTSINLFFGVKYETLNRDITMIRSCILHTAWDVNMFSLSGSKKSNEIIIREEKLFDIL